MNTYHVFSVEDLATVAERDAITKAFIPVGKHVMIYTTNAKIFCHFHWIDVLIYFDTEGLLS
jgi:hypothetical protein